MLDFDVRSFLLFLPTRSVHQISILSFLVGCCGVLGKYWGAAEGLSSAYYGGVMVAHFEVVIVERRSR